MRFTLLVDRANVAAAAGVMQKELDLSNIALGHAPALRHKHSARTTFDREATKRARRG
jgi:hypothetical protein